MGSLGWALLPGVAALTQRIPLYFLAQTGLLCTLPAVTLGGNRVSRSPPEVSNPAICRILPWPGTHGLNMWLPSHGSKDPKTPRWLEPDGPGDPAYLIPLSFPFLRLGN